MMKGESESELNKEEEEMLRVEESGLPYDFLLKKSGMEDID
jgi:hypothetical protein